MEYEYRDPEKNKISKYIKVHSKSFNRTKEHGILKLSLEILPNSAYSLYPLYNPLRTSSPRNQVIR